VHSNNGRQYQSGLKWNSSATTRKGIGIELVHPFVILGTREVTGCNNKI